MTESAQRFGYPFVTWKEPAHQVVIRPCDIRWKPDISFPTTYLTASEWNWYLFLPTNFEITVINLWFAYKNINQSLSFIDYIKITLSAILLPIKNV